MWLEFYNFIIFIVKYVLLLLLFCFVLEPRHEKNKELDIVENLNVEFDESRIKSFSFPEYKDPNKKDDMVCVVKEHIFFK